ncbi:MAG TPA: hypothetical protein VMM58_08700 [Bacteroidota bacterium]|nr:hypothetical protein [Bacteroidota bacterium]
MNFAQKAIAVISLGVFSSGTAFAGDTYVAKYAGEFMAIGVGGRALGLGGAYVALANDVTAGYWNPAALVRINYPEFSLMHDEQFGSLENFDYAGVAFPYGANDTTTTVSQDGTSTPVVNYNASTFAVNVIRLGIDGIPDTRKLDTNGDGVYNDLDARPDISQITFFNSADWALYFSYAKQHSEHLYYGANLKLIFRQIGEYHATGIGFDLGALYAPNDHLSLGVNAQDITTTLVAWNTGTNELISPTLKIGGAYLFELFGGRLGPALDADVRFENRQFASIAHVGPVSFDPHGGVEYDYKKVVALRVGYNDVKSLTLGAGVHLRKLDIDYSFAKFDGADQLGNSHRISLRLIIQEDKYRRGSE